MERLKSIIEFVKLRKMVSVPMLQKEFGSTYAEMRLIVADLQSYGVLSYEGMENYKYVEDAENGFGFTRGRKNALSNEPKGIDENVELLAYVCADKRYSNDEIKEVLKKIYALQKQASGEEKKTERQMFTFSDYTAKRREELLRRLQELRREAKDDEDEETDGAAVVAELPDAYKKLGDKAKEIIDKAVKIYPDYSKTKLYETLKQQGRNVSVGSFEGRAYLEVWTLLLNISEETYSLIRQWLKDNK